MGFQVSEDKECRSNSEVNRVEELKNQLVEEGYDSNEVDYLITMHTDEQDFGRLDQHEFKALVEALEQLLCIARGCEDLKQ